MSPLKRTTDLFHLTLLFPTSTASLTPSTITTSPPMSNRYSSSAARRNYPPPSQAPVEVPSRRKKLVDARNPLRDLNGAGPSCNIIDVSSSSSIEAPRGCLRFFLSHSSSSTRNKPPQSRSEVVPQTPKSAPAPKLRKNPRFRKRPIACQKIQSLSISGQERAESVNELQSHELGKVNLDNESASDSTPAAEMKPELGFEQQSRVNQVLEEKSDDSKIKTPPLLPSLSPEIQCGPNAVPLMEMKQTCYGAGHLLSGVPDKRKCRPRGVLCVRAKGSIFDLSSVDEDTDIGTKERLDFSPVLLPQEASVHWFSSPCNEVAEFEDSPSLCFSSDLSKKSSGSCATYSSMDTSSSMSKNSGLRPSRGFQGFVNFESSSPIEMTSPRVLASKERGSAQFLNSPPLLSSGNVIQTPSSGSAADRHRLVDLVTDNVDLSFRLDCCLDTPCNSIDMAQVQRVLDCKECWVSDSTVSAFKSQSPLRISWRDGLVGRIIEMDDDDLCRCFSDDDEEEHFTEDLKPLIYTPEKSPDEVKAQVSRNDKEMNRGRVQCAAMESMSFDGDRLMESSDSDWNLCYRNELFRV